MRASGPTGALRTFGPWVALAVAVGAFPFLVSPYWALIGSFVVVYAIVALSLTVLTGWAGPSRCHRPPSSASAPSPPPG